MPATPQTRRVLVLVSAKWRDARTTATAFKRVEEVYKGPYTLVLEDNGDKGTIFATTAAHRLGWGVEPYLVDQKCAAECTPGHRRQGGPDGDWCPTASRRALDAQLDRGIDVCIALMRSNGAAEARLGQQAANHRGIAVWRFAHARQEAIGRGVTSS